MKKMLGLLGSMMLVMTIPACATAQEGDNPEREFKKRMEELEKRQQREREEMQQHFREMMERRKQQHEEPQKPGERREERIERRIERREGPGPAPGMERLGNALGQLNERLERIEKDVKTIRKQSDLIKMALPMVMQFLQKGGKGGPGMLPFGDPKKLQEGLGKLRGHFEEFRDHVEDCPVLKRLKEGLGKAGKGKKKILKLRKTQKGPAKKGPGHRMERRDDDDDDDDDDRRGPDRPRPNRGGRWHGSF